MSSRRLDVLVVSCLLAAACTAETPRGGAIAPRSPTRVAAPTVPEVEAEPEPKVHEPDPFAWELRGNYLGVVRGWVFVGVGRGVQAMRARCTRACEPSTYLGPGSYHEPAVLDGRLYVGTDEGILAYRFPCPRERCRPLSRITSDARPGLRGPIHEVNSYRVAAIHGTLLVLAGWDGAAGSGIYPSVIETYDPTCLPGCPPMWRSGVADARMTPLLTGGALLAPHLDGIEAFAWCGGDVCSRRWFGEFPGGPGGMWPTDPVIAGDQVVLTDRGCFCGSEASVPVVMGFELSCGPGPCEPVWYVPFPGTRFNSGVLPLESGLGVVIDTPHERSGLVLPSGCDARCIPLARLRTSTPVGSSALGAGDLIIAGLHARPVVVAFDATCVGTCSPVARTRLGGRIGPMVADGEHVFAVGGTVVVALDIAEAVGTWGPSWTWEADRRIQHLTRIGSMLVVATQRTAYGVPTSV